MNVATPPRLAAIAALLVASLAQGASAVLHQRPVFAEPGLERLAGRGSRFRGGQGGGGFGRGGQDVALVAEFDKNGNGRLEALERRAARPHAESLGLNRGRGGRGGGSAVVVVEPGRAVSPDSVKPYPATPFYDPGTLRTLFLTFENSDWERELMAFKRTDIDVPAA